MLLVKNKMSFGYQDPECTVFVSNVDTKVTQEHLWELFLQAGPLRNVKIPFDKASGKNRTFAFVCFKHEISVGYACELFNTLKMFERPIYCKPNKDGGKSSQPASPRASQNTSVSETPPIRDDRRAYSQGSEGRDYHNSGNREYREPYNSGGRDNRDNNRRSYDQNNTNSYQNRSQDGNRYNASPRSNREDDYNRQNSNDRFNDPNQSRGFDLRQSLSSPPVINAGNLSPLFLKAVNHSLQHGSYNYNQSPHHDSPSNFGPQRPDQSKQQSYQQHRNNRRQRPY